MKNIIIIFSLITSIAVFGCNNEAEKSSEKQDNSAINTEQTETGRWSEKKAQTWGKEQGWIVGANFSPSNASNQLEMWQANTWSPELIDKELAWAAEIGMNTMRVYLHNFPFRDDKAGFLNRIDKYLSISDKHGIKTMFVFFDAVWNPNPKAGPQPQPKKHLHNAGWLQAPGKEILWNPDRHKELKPYVQEIMERFKNDERVLLWDMFNEPQNTNDIAYKDSGKEKFALMLLKKSFEWAREVNPSQPISSAPWLGQWMNADSLSDFDKFMFENSDVITYHNYNEIEDFKMRTEALKRYNRPIICTEYMARGNQSLFETHLPYMAENNIGAINWGLVAGRTQTIYPWESWWKEYTKEPEVWFHDIFYPDGKPYKQAEVDLMKELTGKYNKMN